MIYVVLESTSHPGNIGSVARAMKTMGLDHLVLYQPKEFPSETANRLATHGIDILEKAHVINDLNRFIYEMDLVVACTKRSRKIQIDQHDAHSACLIAAGAHQKGQNVALLFGNETSGLANETIEKCHHILEIPMASNAHSLNLSHAVQIVLYEMQNVLAANRGVSIAQDEMPQADEKLAFEAHMRDVIENSGYIKFPSAMDRLYAMLRRLRPDRRELQLLFGLIKQAKDYRPEKNQED